MAARRLFGNSFGGGRGGRPSSSSTRRHHAAKKEAIQLLDKTGVATLVRLLFFPQPLKKQSLQNILVSLCDNSKTRIDLINLLLTILHEGTRENGAGGAVVDKTFSQMSLERGGKTGRPVTARSKSQGGGLGSVPATPSTPFTSTASQAAPSTPGPSLALAGLPSSLVSAGEGENIPNLVVQRSLEALTYLVAANESSAMFFLTEQELPLNLGGQQAKPTKTPGTGKREKGKGRAISSGGDIFGTPGKDGSSGSRERICPIVVLLALLDRSSLTKTPSIMEALTKLLSHITVQLRYIEKDKKRKEELEKERAGAAKAKAEEEAQKASEQQAEGTQDATVPKEPTQPSTSTVPSKRDREEEERLFTQAPSLPPNYLRMVVNILDLGECSSKMFSAALGLIHNLWHLPEARTILSHELIALAQKYGRVLLSDLGDLEVVLESGEVTKSASTLSKFSQASSAQAKILRVLKTIEHAKQQEAKEAKRREKEQKDEEERQKKKQKLEEAAKELAEGSSASAAGAAADSKKSEEKTAEDVPATDNAKPAATEMNKVEELYAGFDFSPVWSKLSDCLTIIEKNGEDVSNAGTLLPLIECFLLVSNW